MSRRIRRFVAIGALLCLGLGADGWLRSHCLVYKPGDAVPASSLTLPNDPGLTAGGGSLLYTTVHVLPATLFDAARSLFAAGHELKAIEEAFASAYTLEAYEARLAELMQESLDVATVVAFRHLGLRVDAPNGTGQPSLRAKPRRETVGPSAALMVALELVRQRTRGLFPSGVVVAGTGELRTDGAVLPVSGVRQKVIAAKRAGADVFLAPRDNAREAQTVAPGMRVLPVDTFEQAIGALKRLGEEESTLPARITG